MLTLLYSPASLLARPSSHHWTAICQQTLVAVATGPRTIPHGTRAWRQPTVPIPLKPPPKPPSCLAKVKSGDSRLARLCSFLRGKHPKGSVVSAPKSTRASRARLAAWVSKMTSCKGVTFADDVFVKVISRCGSYDRAFDDRQMPYAEPLRRSRARPEDQLLGAH